MVQGFSYEFAAIEQVGAQVRFLPPYSLDFNPIELAFAKLKAFLRAMRLRTYGLVCSSYDTHRANWQYPKTR